jgi:hypothetical protein
MTQLGVIGSRPSVRYVHLLLFACPDCNLPVSISRVSNEKDLETVDAEHLRITCSYCEFRRNRCRGEEALR